MTAATSFVGTARQMPAAISSMARAPRETAGWGLALICLLSFWTPSAEFGASMSLVAARYGLFALSIGLLLTVKSVRQSINIVGRSAIVALLLVACTYIAATSLWSGSLLSGIGKGALFLESLLIALLAVGRFGPIRALTICGSAVLAFVFAGSVLAVVYPDWGQETWGEHLGMWKGFSNQKNLFGVAVAIAFIALLQRRTRPLALKLTGLALLAFAMLKSGSRGGEVDLAAGLAFLLVTRLPSKYQKLVLVLLAGLAVALLLIVGPSVDVDARSGNIGVNDVEFDTSNRLKIWQFGLDGFKGYELFGFGLEGFWTDLRALEFSGRNGWVLPDFHNGYFSLLIDAGIVGIVLFGAALLALSLSLFRNLPRLRAFGLESHGALVFMFLVHNLYENTIVRATNGTLFIFEVAAFGYLAAISQRPAIQQLAAIPDARTALPIR